MLSILERAQASLCRLQGFRFSHVRTDVGGMRVLRLRGQGPLPPVVLLHGLACSALDLEPVLRRLRPYVREIIAPDLPGHGGSERPRGGMRADILQHALVQALDAILYEPAVVLGTSLGGAGALRFALARPDMVLGLYLASPGGARIPEQDFEQLRGNFDTRTHRSALQLIDTLLVDRYPIVRHAMGWAIRKRLGRPAMRELVDSFSQEDFFTHEALQTLSMPITVMWGRNERLLPDSCLDFFQRALPAHTQFYRPAGVGHAPNMERPGMLASRLVSFTREVAQRRLPARTRSLPLAEAA